MHNSITVTFMKGLYTVIAAINLNVIKRIEKIESAIKANEIALQLVKKYKEEGIEVEILELW